MHMKTNIVIFSGYNQRAIIAFLRTLDESNLTCFIIASSKDDPIFFTKYRKDVSAIREKRELDMDDILKCLNSVKNKLSKKDYVVMPTTEALIRFFLDNGELFKKNGFNMPIVHKELYENISDKYKFSSICSKYEIIIPREYDNVTKLEVPFVAKPKRYYSSSGKVFNPILIYDEKEKNEFINNYNKEDFYYQEFIEGRSFYLLYYFSRKGEIYKFSQENFIQQYGGKSIIAAVSSDYHERSESLKYEKIFKDLNFFGLVMIEIRERKGLNYMIEANPRFWGPSQLFVDAGINLFLIMLYDLNIIKNNPSIDFKKKNISKYFWFGGLFQTLNCDQKPNFYNYSPGRFVGDLSLWIKSDIYKRSDTVNVFMEEIKI